MINNGDVSKTLTQPNHGRADGSGRLVGARHGRGVGHGDGHGTRGATALVVGGTGTHRDKALQIVTGLSVPLPTIPRVDDISSAGRSTSGAREGPGEPELLPLTPEYDEEQHGVYVARLEAALDGDDQRGTLNIALMGGYGLGKSSVLRQLTVRRKDAINLSLSTLGADAVSTTGAAPDQERAATPTNRIQKEIVKQLLYRERPSRVPGSRYRRIPHVPWWQEAFWAAALATGTLFVLYALGPSDYVVERLLRVVTSRPAAYSVCWLFLATVLFFASRTLRHRVSIQEVSAGPASISLSGRSDTFFDEYLDEIVYFFQRTRCTTVVFEDLDRFDDPHIFDSLRELNTLLNNVKDLERRPIRFIYAIKDSIFDQLGSPASTADAATSELARANRTKFFDLVIPMVPFITHRSARDQMSSILERSDAGVSRDLIYLAARHVADMRLIKNIHNEFVIFASKVLPATGGVPGLTKDSLFALMLYKNIHLTDFERIRYGDSRLDGLYALSRRLVTEHVQRLDRELQALRRASTRGAVLERRSARLGAAFERHIQEVMRQVGNSVAQQLSSTVDGEAFGQESFGSPEMWTTVAEMQGSVTVTGVVNGYYPQKLLTLTKADVVKAVGEPLSVEDWALADAEHITSTTTALEAERRFLLGADMHDLIGRPDLKVEINGAGESLTSAAERLGSELATALVTHGYIDRNFTLYASTYFGVHLSAEAMNFVVHNVHHDTMDPFFRFPSAEDITALLREHGTTLVRQRSAYNIQILDHLATEPGEACGTVLRNLSRWGDDERTFMTAYLAGGSRVPAVFQRLAPLWRRTFWLAVHGDVGLDGRAPVLDAALRGATPGMIYEVDHQVRDAVMQHSDQLPVLTRTSDPSTAARVVRLLDDMSVELPALAPLSPVVRDHVIRARAYGLTAQNLRVALGEPVDLALDTIRAANRDVFDYAMTRLDRYVETVMAGDVGSPTVRSPDMFTDLLEQAVEHDEAAAHALAGHASPGCVVTDLSSIDRRTWPALTATGRCPCSWGNVNAYLEHYGEIDRALAILLRSDATISGLESAPQESRVGLAVRVLAAAELDDAEVRVRLVMSLELNEPLTVEEVEPEEGALLPLLLEHGLIEDTPDLFATAAALSWPTREGMIAASPRFHEHLTPDHLVPADLPSLFRSSRVPAATKAAALAQLADLARGAKAPMLTPAADHAIITRAQLNAPALIAMATAGVERRKVVAALHPAAQDLPPSELDAVLQALGPIYAALTRPGRRPVTVPDDPAHEALLHRLQNYGPVSTWNRSRRAGNLTVYLKHA